MFGIFRRLAYARGAGGDPVLVAPDLLLLDEPTNYLDLEGVLWLEDYLKRYRGTIVVISHDRDLLDSVAEFILHLEHGKLELYTGNYETFVQTRAACAARSTRPSRRSRIWQRKHLQSFVERFRAKASKARQAQSRIKMLEKLKTVDIPMDEHIAAIKLPSPAEVSPPLISLDRVAVGYEPGKPVLSNISLRFDPDDRIALLGKNGNGKSTLAKLLAGKLDAMSGEMTPSRKLVPGYFAQHQLDELDGTLTPVETLARFRPKMTVTELRTRLGGMGLVGRQSVDARRPTLRWRACAANAGIGHTRPPEPAAAGRTSQPCSTSMRARNC